MSFYDLCYRWKISVLDILYDIHYSGKEYPKKKRAFKHKNIPPRNYNKETNLRICTTCGRYLPWTIENFHYSNKRLQTLGYMCRDCKARKNKEYHNQRKKGGVKCQQ